MGLIKRLSYWYTFPINNSHLTPSVFWQIVFMLSLPFLLWYMVCIHSYDSFKERKAKRMVFKEEYKKQKE
jgi:hypothetical protein